MLTITTTIGSSSSTAVASSWQRHLEAAVAVDADDGRVRPRRLRADRGRDAVAHRPEAARGDERARPVAAARYCIAHIWCWPTPVVQTTSSRPAVSSLQRLEHRLRLQQLAVRSRVAERELARATPRSGCEPRLRARLDLLRRELLRRARASTGLSGPTTGMSAWRIFDDLGRVDVEVHDGGAGRERRDLAR